MVSLIPDAVSLAKAQAEKLAVVLWGAPWSDPSNEMEAVLEALEEEFPGGACIRYTRTYHLSTPKNTYQLTLRLSHFFSRTRSKPYCLQLPATEWTSRPSRSPRAPPGSWSSPPPWFTSKEGSPIGSRGIWPWHWRTTLRPGTRTSGHQRYQTCTPA
jgi:hypothetical protein